jgi:hypothetical protein
MSKSSPKQRTIQLKEWLESRKSATQSNRKFSKADLYNNTEKRYGTKKSN